MSNNDNVTPFRRPTAKKNPNEPQKPKHEPIFNIPPVCNYLMIALLAVHLLRLFLPEGIAREIIINAAFIPARYGDFEMFWSWPAFISPITHMFIHGGWSHLLINIAMLMAFGTAVERFMGGKKMILLILGTGLLGALAYFLLNVGSGALMIGISGAISGLFACALLIMQASGRIAPGRKGLYPIIAIWLGISFLFGAFGAPGIDAPIAWATHVGGFAAGFALFNPVRKMKL